MAGKSAAILPVRHGSAQRLTKRSYMHTSSGKHCTTDYTVLLQVRNGQLHAGMHVPAQHSPTVYMPPPLRRSATCCTRQLCAPRVHHRRSVTAAQASLCSCNTPFAVQLSIHATPSAKCPRSNPPTAPLQRCKVAAQTHVVRRLVMTRPWHPPASVPSIKAHVRYPHSQGHRTGPPSQPPCGRTSTCAHQSRGT